MKKKRRSALLFIAADTFLFTPLLPIRIRLFRSGLALRVFFSRVWEDWQVDRFTFDGYTLRSLNTPIDLSIVPVTSPIGMIMLHAMNIFQLLVIRYACEIRCLDGLLYNFSSWRLGNVNQTTRHALLLVSLFTCLSPITAVLINFQVCVSHILQLRYEINMSKIIKL